MSIDPSIVVHEAAICESDEIGARTQIWAFAHVLAGARVGVDCKIGGHVFVEGGAVLGDRVTVKNGALIWCGVIIGDDCFIGPQTVFTNDRAPRVGFPKYQDELLGTRVGRGASIGANATVLCGLTIGEHAMIGAGSVVTHDVAPYAVVTGNPARFLDWCCQCGERLDPKLICSCGRCYERVEGDDGLRPV